MHQKGRKTGINVPVRHRPVRFVTISPALVVLGVPVQIDRLVGQRDDHQRRLRAEPGEPARRARPLRLRPASTSTTRGPPAPSGPGSPNPGRNRPTAPASACLTILSTSSGGTGRSGSYAPDHPPPPQHLVELHRLRPDAPGRRPRLARVPARSGRGPSGTRPAGRSSARSRTTGGTARRAGCRPEKTCHHLNFSSPQTCTSAEPSGAAMVTDETAVRIVLDVAERGVQHQVTDLARGDEVVFRAGHLDRADRQQPAVGQHPGAARDAQQGVVHRHALELQVRVDRVPPGSVRVAGVDDRPGRSAARRPTRSNAAPQRQRERVPHLGRQVELERHRVRLLLDQRASAPSWSGRGSPLCLAGSVRASWYAVPLERVLTVADPVRPRGEDLAGRGGRQLVRSRSRPRSPARRRCSCAGRRRPPPAWPGGRRTRCSTGSPDFAGATLVMRWTLSVRIGLGSRSVVDIARRAGNTAASATRQARPRRKPPPAQEAVAPVRVGGRAGPQITQSRDPRRPPP